MHYYLVEITFNDGKKIRAVKSHSNGDIDHVWKEIKHKAQMHYKLGAFSGFDCVKISRFSHIFYQYLKKNNIPYNPHTMIPIDPLGPNRA